MSYQPGTPNLGSSYSADQQYNSLSTPAGAHPATEAAAPAKSRKKLWIILGLVGTLVVLGGIGAGVGVAVSNNNKNNKANASNTDGGDKGQSNGGSGDNSTITDPGSNGTDYSNFERNPDFKRSFYAMAYTSDKGLYPECGVTLEDVIHDVQILSQLTNLVRIYGGNCNLPEYMLEAIQLTKVDLKVYLGNYIQLDNDESYQRQKVAIEDALKKYGTENVAGITVGNEVMLNYCLDQGTTDANADIVKPASDYIIASIADTRSSLAALGFGDVKVGNADAGSYFSTAVLEASDYGLSNVHPWFAQQTVTASVDWTWNFFEEQNVQPAAALANRPEMFLAETGWPSGSAWENTTNSGAGVGGEASVANLQIFLDNFVCQSNTQGIKYFYFELFDQLWKDQQFGGVEGYWGLLDAERKLKTGLTIPSCTY